MISNFDFKLYFNNNSQNSYLFRNPDSRYNNTKSSEFGGAGTCKEMHPCPFDMQEIVGIHLPESDHNVTKYISNGEIDIHLDLMS